MTPFPPEPMNQTFSGGFTIVIIIIVIIYNGNNNHGCDIGRCGSDSSLLYTSAAEILHTGSLISCSISNLHLWW